MKHKHHCTNCGEYLPCRAKFIPWIDPETGEVTRRYDTAFLCRLCEPQIMSLAEALEALQKLEEIAVPLPLEIHSNLKHTQEVFMWDA